MALAAVASGGLGSPNQEFAAGAEIDNYHLYKEDDEGIAQYMQLDPGGNTMVFVGPDVATNTQLCADVAGCATRGDHNCAGILGRYRGDLVVLACRGVKGKKNEATRAFGSDSDDPLAELSSEMGEWVTGFVARVKADPAAAETEFDALPEGTKTMLSPYQDINTWNQARWVRFYANQDDFDGFVGQVNTSTVDKERLKRWFVDVPAYADAFLYLIVVRLRQAMAEGKAASSEEERTAAVEQMMQNLTQAKTTVESLLGFPVDQARLTTYPPMVELLAQLEAEARAEEETAAIAGVEGTP
jgi:hypothetical protein